MRNTDFEIFLQTRVGTMDDQIDRKRRATRLRIVSIMVAQFLSDSRQPLIQGTGRTGIQRRKRSHHPCLTLSDHELRPRDDE